MTKYHNTDFMSVVSPDLEEEGTLQTLSFLIFKPPGPSPKHLTAWYTYMISFQGYAPRRILGSLML